MIGAPVPGVVNALQVTIPGRSPSVSSVKALGNAGEKKKSIPIMQGGCRLSMNCTVVLKEWFANLMVIEYVPLEFNIWPLAAHNLIGFPLRGKAFLSNIWFLSLELIKVKEDPVSKSADSCLLYTSPSPRD